MLLWSWPLPPLSTEHANSSGKASRISGAEFRPNNYYPDRGISMIFLSFCLKVGRDHFLPRYFKSIILLSPNHSTVCNINYWERRQTKLRMACTVSVRGDVANITFGKSARWLDILHKCLHGFFQPLQANAGLVILNYSITVSFRIPSSSAIILSSYAIQHE
jgi:hypothetical protein